MAKATTEPFWPPGSEPNALQRRFIEFADGAALLQAPVGTGKTRSLADRAAAAIRRGVPADRILCLTFTNRAAEQLRERVRDRCGEEGRGIVVRTFHSLCAWILRREHERVGLPADFVVYDEEDGQEVLADVLRRLGSGWGPSAKDLKEMYHGIQEDKTRLASGTIDVRTIDDGLAARSRWRADAVVRYQRELRARRAVDFGDLVLLVRGLFDTAPAVKERWSRRFDMLQVDEMQDTNWAEYLVVRDLAGCSNIVLVGDFDQTIYEWRGSAPDEIVEQFREDFPGVRDFRFTDNYRATRTLIEAANAVAATYSAHPPVSPAEGVEEGEPVAAHFARNPRAEALWMAGKIRTLVGGAERVRPRDIAVLVRTNNHALDVSRVFQDEGIPHVTVEQFEFFRRQEVKDALAYLRFLLYPADAAGFRRILQRPAQGIGLQTIAAIEGAQGAGLRLTDMVGPGVQRFGDPFGPLLQAYDEGAVTVFDTETTGLDPGRDEIVELGAVRLEKGRVVDRFEALLRSGVPVGDSETIHGISDARLAAEGRDPASVLAEFAQFIRGSLLVGHNVSFDVSMLVAAGARHGVPFDIPLWGDTLELARRFTDRDSLTLENLAAAFSIEAEPTHRALADVEATVALLGHLIPLARRHASVRRQAAGRFRDAFEPLARRLDGWRERIGRERPPRLLRRVLEESGLLQHYGSERGRMANLAELQRIFDLRDDGAVEPRSALESLVRFTALARNLDRLDEDNDAVRVITVHQAKGLEFDTVFVGAMAENEFPFYFAVRDGNIREELRVFYVAVTRARRRLFLSGHAINRRGYQNPPSQFFRTIGPRWVEEGSAVMGGR